MDLCQQVMARNVPQLVRLLLDTPLEGGGHVDSKADQATFERCLAFAKERLQPFENQECCPEAVWHNMNHFIERYRSENLPEFADTFKQLANVVLNHPLCTNHTQKNLQWCLMDFMLSVNYKAFKEVRRNRREMLQKRMHILEALAMATEGSEVLRVPQGGSARGSMGAFDRTSTLEWAEKTPSEGSENKPAFFIPGERRWSKETGHTVQNNPNRFTVPDIGANLENATFNLSLDSPQPRAASDSNSLAQHLNEVHVTENFSTNEANMNLLMNLTQVESSLEKPTKVNYYRGMNDLLTRIYTPWWQVDIHVHQQSRTLPSSFSHNYGEWLLHQLRESQSSVRRMTEEHQLLRELLILFFISLDSGHFQVKGHGVEVLTAGPQTCALSQLLEGAILGRVFKYLEQMGYLRQLIESNATPRVGGYRLETVVAFTVAVRRLLRPVIEFLVYYERRLAAGKEAPTVKHFLHVSEDAMQRLRLLFEVPEPKVEGRASLCSLGVLDSLVLNCTLPGQSKEEISLSASLLLHSLQAYCHFIDCWWTSGEFQDWQDEFPFQKLQVDGRTEYGLRKYLLEEEVHLGGCLFKVIKDHLGEASQAVATLCDTRRMGDFVALHGTIFQVSLHNFLMEAVLKELLPYQAERVQDYSYAPDIMQQLKSVDQETVRRLFYAYHMETRPDPRHPARCSVDELVKNFQSCVDYTPIVEIICDQLAVGLRRRTLLANSYVTHLVKTELQLHRTAKHLRSVYTLEKYELLQNEFEEFFSLLSKKSLKRAEKKMKEIVDAQDPNLAYLFNVDLKGTRPDSLTLSVGYDIFLNQVITQGQFEQLNTCFRLILSMHWTLYRLKRLAPLKNFRYRELKGALQTLRDTLEKTLEEQLQGSGKVKQLAEILNHSEERLVGCTISGLRQEHEWLLRQISDIVSEEMPRGNFSSRMEEFLGLCDVLYHLWLKAASVLNNLEVQKPRNTCEMKFEWLTFFYLQRIHKHCKVMASHLGVELINN
ncbi:uncharacterized protein Dana_GF24706 [Drosophila ananassae]|uniref:Gamma-tubulin complex component n=1 Tax=Drosophila ananassae TaxID=7217 RepID=B3M9M0_DROAN|nr:uncharacterized protein LOC6507337 [Drosophila ananassae]EDV39026.1 uncharacterized protein Dana_GF24706 [Drosophila ananassae]